MYTLIREYWHFGLSVLLLTCFLAPSVWAEEPAAEEETQVVEEPAAAPVVDVYLEAIKNPAQVEDLNAEVERGKRFLRLGALEQAHAAFRNVTAKDSQHLRALEGLRNTLSQASRTDLLPEVLASLAKVYKANGDDGMANGRYLELITLAPEHRLRADVEKALNIVQDGAVKNEVSWFDLYFIHYS